jgi:hypothetical protein
MKIKFNHFKSKNCSNGNWKFLLRAHWLSLRVGMRQAGDEAAEALCRNSYLRTYVKVQFPRPVLLRVKDTLSDSLGVNFL